MTVYMNIIITLLDVSLDFWKSCRLKFIVDTIVVKISKRNVHVGQHAQCKTPYLGFLNLTLVCVSEHEKLELFIWQLS